MLQMTSMSDRQRAFVLIIHLACAHDVRLPYINAMQVPKMGEQAYCFACERDIEVIGVEVISILEEA